MFVFPGGEGGDMRSSFRIVHTKSGGTRTDFAPIPHKVPMPGSRILAKTRLPTRLPPKVSPQLEPSTRADRQTPSPKHLSPDGCSTHPGFGCFGRPYEPMHGARCPSPKAEPMLFGSGAKGGSGARGGQPTGLHVDIGQSRPWPGARARRRACPHAATHTRRHARVAP